MSAAKVLGRISVRGAALAGMTLAAGCTWVEPDAGGATMHVAHRETETTHCTDLGRTVTVSVKHEVLGVERNALKVADELESLARNEAATIPGADTVRALGPVVAGEQRFGVYRCQ